MALLLHPGLELLGESGEAQEEMLGIPDLGGAPADAAARIDQVHRIQWFATLIALVPPGFGKVTIGAGPLHVPVGKEATAIGTIGQGHLILVYVAPVKKCTE